jgi:hypothetical protein
VGFIGEDVSGIGTILETTSFSAADYMTLYLSALPIHLTQQSTARSISVSNTPNQSNPSSTLRTLRPSHTLSFPGSSHAEPGNEVDIKIGVGVGVVVVLILLIIGYILLMRYRRKRLFNHHHPLDSPPETPERRETKAVLQTQKKLPPPPPVAELRVEYEGAQAENHGAGIYVWKPELEGTAGIPGAVGVYVQGKSELEANHSGVANIVLGPRPGTAPESPIVGSSFIYQRLGPS